MLIEMKVFGLAIDPITNTPIVILKDLQEKKVVPIWIGLFEASAIATQLEKIDLTRPMTHDLMNDILKNLEVDVKRVVITDLKNNTFFALINIVKDESDLMIDSRPSDAIALALRANAPIYVDDSVIDKSMDINFGNRAGDLNKYTKEQLKEFLEGLNPEDFGKYKM
ncbi:MAG: bifunctional nuclease family protein [Syntrophales bacterium]|jgi:bifunctional DNase/RNase|nr:bifunctional nuclease family protein [Syntrophales bacterium]MDY0044628.1 bifunctional nuclease family protein [Syntrophales bacterium]